MKQFIRPRARQDLVRQFRWYLEEQDATEVAYRFLDAVDDSVEQLLLMPHMGAPGETRNPILKGLRFWPVKGFEEFLIFYLISDVTVRVVRVLHGKRDLETILKKRPTTTSCSDVPSAVRPDHR